MISQTRSERAEVDGFSMVLEDADAGKISRVHLDIGSIVTQKTVRNPSQYQA
jgi:hypothetical protein